jgi:6-phosphogluconolactonase
MKAREIKIFDSRENLANGAAALVVEKIAEALQANAFASFVLSGGSTPKALYQLLASAEFRDRIDWEKVLIFFGDERCVPPDDEESNYKMAFEALLAKVSISETNIFRLKGEIDPAEAAAEYEQEIIKALGDEPRFDVVLLGLGPDGHTASLFPGSAALNETAKLVTANYVEKFDAFRLTMTFRVMNAARNVIFLMAGKDKAETLKAVLEGDNDLPLPAQLIEPAEGKLFWLLDKDAAAAL